MSAQLCITVRLLDRTYHGRADRGEPEWPPSPMRLMQALVAAAGRRSRGESIDDESARALRWLERRPPPEIVAPSKRVGAKHRLYVPDNVADKVASTWSRGGEASIADYRTEKDVWVVRLEEDDPAVHYLWPLDDPHEAEPHVAVLAAAARGLTHFGWGIDMAVASARVITDREAGELAGHRWRPSPSGAPRRTPVAGSFDALERRHRRFLNRLPSPETFTVVPPFTTFAPVNYASPTDRDDAAAGESGRPCAAFAVRKPNGDGFRPFDATRDAARLAGMARHATAAAAKLAWRDDDLVARYVLGHGEARGEAHATVGLSRFAFLPLPSLERRVANGPRTVAAVRRLLITDFAGAPDRVAWASRALSGLELHAEDRRDRAAEDGRAAVALLASIPSRDEGVRRYVEPAAVWTTVTPVALPGYDDPRHLRRRMQREGAALPSAERLRLIERLDERIDQLIRKAIVQAGLPEPLARFAEIEVRSTGFLPGVEAAARHFVPQKHRKYPRWHVRVTWRDALGDPIPVAGPLALGVGKFYGLGLFVGDERPT